MIYNLKLALNLIEDLLAVTPIVLNSMNEINNFCEQNRFHNMQGFLEVPAFSKLLQKLNSRTLYLLQIDYL